MKILRQANITKIQLALELNTEPCTNTNVLGSSKKKNKKK